MRAAVKIFQIEPNWLLPKGNRDFTARERRWGRNRSCTSGAAASST